MKAQSTYSKTTFNTQSGLSLVEIMVALIAGLILIAGVGQTFQSSKRSADMQDELGRLQENARFAMTLLTRSIREAGYLGCSSGVPVTNILNAAVNNYAYDFVNATLDTRLNSIAAIEGFEWTGGTSASTTVGNWTPSRNTFITSPNSGSDILTVRGPIGESLQLTGDMANMTADPTVGANSVLAECDIVIVSDCTGASIIQITNNNPNGGTLSHATEGCEPGNSVASLAAERTASPSGATGYLRGADVIPYGTTSFYVRNGGGERNTEPALFRRMTGRDAEELVEGVEKMQIRYGVDNDALPTPPNTPDYAPNFYVTANQVTDWRRVVSVRISLLMRTRQDRITATPQTYRLDGVEETATDLRLRHVFTTTIGIRNRLP